MNEKQNTYDVAVIGAGVVGSMIARELSMFKARVCLIEAAADVAAGASRANSGIVHAGYDAHPGSLKAKMNVSGNRMMRRTTRELGVPYSNCGSMVVAFGKKDERRLDVLLKRGWKNGVPMKILRPKQIRKMEPMLSRDITAALYAKTAGIVCPFSLTIAAAENAVRNGVQLFLNSSVSAIDKRGGVYRISAGDNEIEAKYVVNAAGINADEISKMAGGEVFDIHPRKGEYIVYDKEMDARTRAVIFPAPTSLGKGVLFAPTVYRNMLAGPTAQDILDKTDKATSASGLASVMDAAARYVPSVDRRGAITVFAGLRAVSSSKDFIIERSVSARNLVNVAGIDSPGLTAAPAIARRVLHILFLLGLGLKRDLRATRRRKPIEVFANASPQRRKQLIRKDGRYANVVCRCEYVTEAQIVQSIHRPSGATTVDGVKFRTSAGAGRCHGGFCMPRVMEILSRELGSDYSEVTKGGDGSYILDGKTKEARR